MSYSITTDVFCDTCGINWVHGITRGWVDKTSAMKNARRQG